ncbi:tripartite tricarboxylate transporter substrate binding protein [Roseomonas eburnea]|uniref:Tripartite tricarboxylate transporter substrate binding protein n=1 Tax=Neoroseomonas eburnea TaxID=1346889 RepID=A0A9X9X793_9PROT|nr:tripartite tricarboxylate transporter substrate binding protein [Neoroseomonas eburnea]MBR0679579.1 tripartite tricarboxylate transporter substrate binding protein [Neoroseomonas eburnea]
MTLTRRGLAALPALALAGGHAQAQGTWPDRPLRVIVAFPGGSTPDLAARAVAPHFQQAFGQPVVVDNRAGGGGHIGTEAIARATDGHTLGVTIGGPGSTAKILNPALGYDPATDLVPISLLARLPFVLVVHPSVPARTAAEFVAYARANPGRISYASTGPGTLSHLAMEDLAATQGFQAVHVPYRAVGQAVLDLVAGRIQAFFAATGGVLAQVREGTVRALAVTSAERFPAIPEVPTMRESGVDSEPAVAWIGLFAPTGMPADRVARVAAEAGRALAVPEQRRALETAGFTVVGSDPDTFRALLASDIQRWGAIIRRLELRPES